MSRKPRSNFRPSMTLTEAICQTVNRGALTPEQLQDEIDYSASSLKRAGLDGESGAGFYLRKLIPLMKAQNDFTILEHLNHHCGLISIPIPKGGRSKADRMRSVNDYQKLAALAVEVLLSYIDNGVSEGEAVDTLHRMLKGTAEMMEEVKAGNQIELDFEG